MQVISLKTFVLEGNYRIVLCLEHSLVNWSGEASFCSSGAHRDQEDNDSNPIFKRFLPTSAAVSFFFNPLKEKRFAHLVITNGDMNYRDVLD